MSIFRAYDIRGIYEKDLTKNVAEKIGKAFGTLIRGKEKVCIGFDTRPSSPTLFENFSSGLISTGCDVISLGIVPNPVAYFYAWKNKIFGSYISASHNPVEWNGFKIFKPNGVSLTKEIEILEKIFNLEKFLKGKGNLKEEKNPMKDYTNFLKKKIGRVKGKIVVDFLGGSGTKSTQLFKKIGLDIIPLHEKPDASLYGFHRLEPWGNLLNTAKKFVRKENADFGVAFDCDADRAVFIDSNGNFVDPSIISAIFIESLLEEKKGKIIITYDCASELEDFVKMKNGKIIWNRIGHGFIEQRLVDEVALFASEQSSHFYFNIFYPFSDAILSTLYLCKILNEKNERLEELANKFRFFPIAKLYISAKTDEKKFRVIEKIKNKFKGTDTVDGVKIKLNEKEWVLIRASQTLPEINICAQGKNKKRLREIVQKYSAIVKEKMSELNG